MVARTAVSTSGAAPDAKIALLFPGKARTRQIFCCGARSHSDVGILAIAFFKFAIGLEDLLGQVGREFLSDDRVADQGPAAMQLRKVLCIEPFQGVLDKYIKARAFQEVIICRRRYRKTGRDRHALLFERPDHFTKRSVLPADQSDVLDANLLKLQNVLCLFHEKIIVPFSAR